MQPGERRIVWAYHDTSDFIDDSWQKHTEKGFVEIALLKEPKPTPFVEFKRIDRDPTTTGAAMIAASLVGNLLLIITVIILCY